MLGTPLRTDSDPLGRIMGFSKHPAAVPPAHTLLACDLATAPPRSPCLLRDSGHVRGCLDGSQTRNPAAVPEARKPAATGPGPGGPGGLGVCSAGWPGRRKNMRPPLPSAVKPGCGEPPGGAARPRRRRQVRSRMGEGEEPRSRGNPQPCAARAPWVADAQSRPFWNPRNAGGRRSGGGHRGAWGACHTAAGDGARLLGGCCHPCLCKGLLRPRAGGRWSLPAGLPQVLAVRLWQGWGGCGGSGRPRAVTSLPLEGQNPTVCAPSGERALCHGSSPGASRWVSGRACSLGGRFQFGWDILSETEIAPLCYLKNNLLIKD